MVNIFVSGANGEVGSALTKNLKTKYTVITDPYQIKDCQIFIHCLSRHPVHNDAANLFSNITYSKKLINEFTQCASKRILINMSSVSLYDKNIEKKTIIYEDSRLTIDNIYQLTKIYMEDYVKTLGIDYVTLRLPGVLEKNNSRSLLPRIANKLYSNDPIIVNENPNFNYFVSTDTISLYCNFIISNFLNEAMSFRLIKNCCQKGCFNLQEILAEMKMYLGSKSKITVLPIESSNFIASKEVEFTDVILSPEEIVHDWFKEKFNR